MPQPFKPTGGARNADGTYATPPVFGNFNAWLDDLAALPSSPQRYYVYMSLESYEQYYAGSFDRGTPEYATAVTSFFHAVADEVTSRGLAKNQFVFEVKDEPSGSSIDQVAADFTIIAKAAEPEFLFFSNPLYATVSQVNTDLMNASDIIVPKLSLWSMVEPC